MSLSEVTKVDDNYRRDSFSDRFCDDLSEVILQYLRFENKLKLECVSKQFQRTIFKKQMVLKYNFCIKSDEDLDHLKRFLQKISNVNKLVIVLEEDPFYMSSGVVLRILETIEKYCNHLIHFEVYIFESQGFDLLFQRFGPKLMSLKLSSPGYINYFEWRSIINIQKLIIDYFPSQLSDMKFNRLKKFQFISSFSRGIEELDPFVMFLELNCNTIKQLSIETPFFNTKDNLISLLKTITKMDKLIDLKIESDIELSDKRIAILWREISMKCLYLKILDIRFDHGDSQNTEAMHELLSTLKLFKSLKRLKIFVNVNKHSVLSFKEFKGIEELTHLTIGLFGPLRDDIIFTDIDINLPKLQYLDILDAFEANEETADILSRLSSLETIILRVTNEEFVSKIKTNLKKNCKKIETINVYKSSVGNCDRSYFKYYENIIPRFMTI